MSRIQELKDSQNRAARRVAVAQVARSRVQVVVEDLSAGPF